MKKNVLLFSVGIITFVFIFIHIVNIIPTSIVKDSKQKEFIVYDTSADWTTVKQKELEPIFLEQDLSNHFVDTETMSCFFITMKMLGHDVDIDQFYWDFFKEVDNEEIPHEGKISPSGLYDISLIYLATQKDLSLSTQYIGDKGFEYLDQVVKNNYPVIVWSGGDDWPQSTPYVAYKSDHDSLCLINSESLVIANKEIFRKNWEKSGSYAILYGKYW